MQYVIETKGNKIRISSPDELELHLEKIKTGKFPDFFLTQQVGNMKGLERFLYKLLGLSTEVRSKSVHVLTKNDISAVIFLDEDYNESRAINTEQQDSQNSTVEFTLETGEKSVHSNDEFIPIEIAIKAVRDFFHYGKKPTWLKYRKVGS